MSNINHINSEQAGSPRSSRRWRMNDRIIRKWLTTAPDVVKSRPKQYEVIPVLAVHFPLRVTASFLRAQRESALHQLSVVDDR